MGENPRFGGIFDVFCPYPCIKSSKVSDIKLNII